MSLIKVGDLVKVSQFAYPSVYFDRDVAYPVVSVEGDWAMVKSKMGVALNMRHKELTIIPEEPRLTTAEYIATIGVDRPPLKVLPIIRGTNPTMVVVDEYTGGSVSYYSVLVEKPTTKDTPPYIAECNDIIEALGMSYAEGNAFKALWRMCAARKGKSKKGYTDGLYDAEKVVFFGQRLVAQLKAAK